MRPWKICSFTKGREEQEKGHERERGRRNLHGDVEMYKGEKKDKE
jgi:hypothetical protein